MQEGLEDYLNGYEQACDRPIMTTRETYRPTLRTLRHELPPDPVSSAEAKVVKNLEKNVGELFDQGYRRQEVVGCMDSFLRELQSDGVDFRGSKVKLDSRGNIIGLEDPGTTYSKYHVFGDYTKKELAWKSLDKRAAATIASAASLTAGAVKRAYDTIDSNILEPIEECTVSPIIDRLYNLAAYAINTAEKALDEALLSFGIAQRPTINCMAFAGSGTSGVATITADIEAYWDRPGSDDREEAGEEAPSLTERIAGFFSALWK